MGLKLTTHLHLVPRLKCVELYLHSPHVLMIGRLITQNCNSSFYFTVGSQKMGGGGTGKNVSTAIQSPLNVGSCNAE
jgi:hypothetical protein